MILQLNQAKNAYVQVPVADLVSSKGPARSFSTSKQLIDWVIQQFNAVPNQPYVDFMVVANGPLGPQVAGPSDAYPILASTPGSPFVPGNDADILCGWHIIYDAEFGLRQSPETGAGRGGWG